MCRSCALKFLSGEVNTMGLPRLVMLIYRFIYKIVVKSVLEILTVLEVVVIL